MRLGMGLLAAACGALGLFPTQFIRLLDPLTQQLTGQQLSGQLSAANGLVLTSLAGKGGTVSTLGLALMAVCLLPIPFGLWLVFARRTRVRRGPTWDCGQRGLTPQMEYTATGFSKPIRMVFKACSNLTARCSANTISPHFAKTIRPTATSRVFRARLPALRFHPASRHSRHRQAASAYLLYTSRCRSGLFAR